MATKSAQIETKNWKTQLLQPPKNEDKPPDKTVSDICCRKCLSVGNPTMWGPQTVAKLVCKYNNFGNYDSYNL